MQRHTQSKADAADSSYINTQPSSASCSVLSFPSSNSIHPRSNYNYSNYQHRTVQGMWVVKDGDLKSSPTDRHASDKCLFTKGMDAKDIGNSHPPTAITKEYFRKGDFEMMKMVNVQN